MSSKHRLIEFNTEAKWITVLFILYIAIVIISVSPVSDYNRLFSALTSRTGALTIVAIGLVGLKASRMFGGKRNFTGKLMLYFSLAIFAEAASWIIWPFFAGAGVPSGATLVIVAVGAMVGQAFSSYALLTSVKTIIDKLDRKAWILIFLSLGFSLVLAILLGINRESVLELFFWSALWPSLVFMQLAGALLLINLLGKWYVTEPIAIIVFGHLGFSVILPSFAILNFFFPIPNLALWLVVVGPIIVTSLYTVGVGMSQVRPRQMRVLVKRS